MTRDPTVRLAGRVARVVPAHGLDGAAGRAADESAAPRTVACYRGAVARFDRWLAECGPASFGDDSATGLLCEYLTILGDSGASRSTLRQAARAVRLACESLGIVLAWSSVLATLRGLERRLAGMGRGVRFALPLRLVDLERALSHLARLDEPATCRDRALLALGWFGALRRSEITALNVSDVRVDRRGVELSLRAPKQAPGEVLGVTIPRGVSVACPVAAWEAWAEWNQRDLLGDGIAFPRLGGGGRHVLAERLGQGAVTSVVRRALRDAGVDGWAGYTSHSLRAGLATELAERGVVLAQIANAGRWSSADTALRYARRARRWDDTPLRALIY